MQRLRLCMSEEQKNIIFFCFFLSSVIIHDAHVHVIPRLRQSCKEMCRLIISYQILTDQFSHRNPFWLLAGTTYVRFLYRICHRMFI